MLAHRSHTAGQLNADGGRAGCPQAGEQEILVKWSWTMNFWWNRYDPLKFLWDPRLVFTGLTVLGYNRDTGAWRSGCCPVCSMLHSERQRPRRVLRRTPPSRQQELFYPMRAVQMQWCHADALVDSGGEIA